MLSKEEIQHIALLARIGVKEEELAGYQKDLSAVLDFFRELETAVVDETLSVGHITGLTDVTREDRAEDFGASGRAMLLKNVPEQKDGFVKVKSVF